MSALVSLNYGHYFLKEGNYSGGQSADGYSTIWCEIAGFGSKFNLGRNPENIVRRVASSFWASQDVSVKKEGNHAKIVATF